MSKQTQSPTKDAPKVPVTSAAAAPTKTETAADPKAIARKQKHEAWKAAGLVVRAAMKDGSIVKALTAANMTNVADALKLRFPLGGGGGIRAAGDGPYTKAVALFKGQSAGFAVDELSIFKAARIGRGEMRNAVRDALKKVAPADRMWIQFDAEKESWILLGTGEKTPTGWIGYDLNSKVAKAS